MINTIAGEVNKVCGSSHSKKQVQRSVMSIKYIRKRPRVDSHEPITFQDSELQGIDTTYDDPMVVTARLNEYELKRILDDSGAALDILYYDVFIRL